MKLAITGHRPNKLGGDYALISPLMDRIKLTLRGLVLHYGKDIPDAKYSKLTLITGMALGIDTLFAKLAIEMNIPFIAAVPCFNQQAIWPPKSQKIYEDIIMHELCTVVIVSPRVYDPSVMRIRNEWMVDNCDALIAVWDGSSGGTANCVKYAKHKNRHIDYIDPNSLKF
jgi:uncharacterized phage-like protein YoqJ